MSAKGWFITGTDTGIGKTWVTLWLMRLLQRQGLRVVGMKPVATGAAWENGRWVNEDALALQRAGSSALPYERVNPFVFEPPASPHIAAMKAGSEIDLARIVETYHGLRECADCVLVEGVGGWQVPLNPREKVADLARALGLPVIMVVGLRLGCLNHALLTQQSIRESGVPWLGWIANRVDPVFQFADENIETLTEELERPLLAVVPHMGRAPDGMGEDLPSDAAAEILRVLCA